MKKKSIFKFFTQFAIGITLLLAIVLPSCYYDYGLDSDTNYDVVATLYNTSYNFDSKPKYFLNQTVENIGGGTLTDYGATIFPLIINNMNAYGWVQTTDTGATDAVQIRVGEMTTTTTDVSCGYDYGAYYGYSWYYPDYYCGYSYTYTTGTIAILMADKSQVNSQGNPIQWAAVLNGLTSSQTTQGGTVQQRITTGINQAFVQSAYLRK